MASIVVRQISDQTKERLRRRAAAHGHSMEAEVRMILDRAVAEPAKVDLSWIEELIEIGDRHDPVELEIPERREFPNPPNFSDLA